MMRNELQRQQLLNVHMRILSYFQEADLMEETYAELLNYIEQRQIVLAEIGDKISDFIRTNIGTLVRDFHTSIEPFLMVDIETLEATSEFREIMARFMIKLHKTQESYAEFSRSNICGALLN